MDFIIATNNKDKVKEIKAILAGHNVLSQREAGIQVEAEEDGTTFAQNALIKARSIKKFTDCAICRGKSRQCKYVQEFISKALWNVSVKIQKSFAHRESERAIV